MAQRQTLDKESSEKHSWSESASSTTFSKLRNRNRQFWVLQLIISKKSLTSLHTHLRTVEKIVKEILLFRLTIMRPEEILEFNAAEYAQRASSHSTSHLQEQEISKTRQSIQADSEVGVGAVGAVLTGGLTFMHPLYASREGHVAEKKLELIQAELRRRGVKLYEPGEKDEEAVALDMVVGDVLGDELGGDVLGDEAAPEGALQNVAADMVGGLVVDEGLKEIGDGPKPKPKPPPATAGSGGGSGSGSGSRSCSRMKLPKWTPLKCHSCGTWFDSSLTTYLRKLLYTSSSDLPFQFTSKPPLPPNFHHRNYEPSFFFHFFFHSSCSPPYKE